MINHGKFISQSYTSLKQAACGNLKYLAPPAVKQYRDSVGPSAFDTSVLKMSRLKI